MATIYNGKHVVFEEVGLGDTSYQWNSPANIDNDNAYNDWNISDMRTTTLPARLLLLSSDLQAIITNTTIQTATNGNNGTLVSTTDKLFLPAEKEMSETRTYSRAEEFNALTTWNYWTTHTQASDRKKYDNTSTARFYWLRSSFNGSTNQTIIIDTNGYFSYIDARNSYRISLCYAL